MTDEEISESLDFWTLMLSKANEKLLAQAHDRGNLYEVRIQAVSMIGVYQEIKRLRAHIANMSCCCAGCTKHNQQLGEEKCT